jgi:hypothetical protein
MAQTTGLCRECLLPRPPTSAERNVLPTSGPRHQARSARRSATGASRAGSSDAVSSRGTRLFSQIRWPCPLAGPVPLSRPQTNGGLHFWTRSRDGCARSGLGAHFVAPLPSVGPYVARGSAGSVPACSVRLRLLRGYRAGRLPIIEALPYAPEDVRMPRAAGDASCNACRRAGDGQSCTAPPLDGTAAWGPDGSRKTIHCGSRVRDRISWRWISNASENARQSPIRSRPRRC